MITKIFADRELKHGGAGCMLKIVKASEDSTAVNHCAQMRLTFKKIDRTIDERERMKCRTND